MSMPAPDPQTLDAPILRAAGRVKSFAGRRVNGVDWQCRAGQVLGLLGANGASKTATLRLCAGFLQPNAGAIHVAGIDRRAEAGVKVHCLALGGVDLTSPAGRMTMQVIAAVAEFERDLLIERTHSGISRAKEAGKRFGRPPSLNVKERALVIERLSGVGSIPSWIKSTP